MASLKEQLQRMYGGSSRGVATSSMIKSVMEDTDAVVKKDEFEKMVAKYGIDLTILHAILLTPKNKLGGAKKRRLERELEDVVRRHGSEVIPYLRSDHVNEKGKISVGELLEAAGRRVD